MKRLALILAFIAAPAVADPYGFRHGGGWDRHEYHGGGGGWVAPMILGGVIGYELGRPRYEPPIIVQQPPPVVYTTTLPPPPLGYHYAQLIDPMCNCYKYALVPN